MKNEELKLAFFRNTWIKFLCILFAFIALMFFTNDFGQSDIEKSAIVMALGIDSSDGGVELTTQIAVPQQSESGANTVAVNVESSGETLAEAISDVNSKTGWYPKLVFCNLIIIGEEAMKNDVFQVLDFLLRDEYFYDTALICACEGKARDILKAKSPINDMTSLSIQKVMSDEAKGSGEVPQISFKDFSIGYFSRSSSSYLPYIKSVPMEKPQSGSGSSSSSGEQGASSPESGGQGGEKESTFSATNCMYVKEGRGVAILDKEQTFAFNLVNSKIKKAYFSVETGGETYNLDLSDNSSSVDFSVKNGAPILKIKVSAKARLHDNTLSNSISEITKYDKVKKEITDAAQKKITELILDAYAFSQSSGADVFGVEEMLYKKENKYYQAFKDDVLTRLNLSVEVKIESVVK